ncbi:GNAT family N-acetyltransferase [Novosphingobium lentum]|uniref:GNAT family N-acetyltransferase n=1 Tax=Novosphingobium lentum TaxID=145287 RepID=UPI0008376697|nr:GNAT family N-acetyltransferase [Novosphingobium lentum]
MERVVYHADINEAQGDAARHPLASAGPFDRIDWFALLAQECLTPHAPLIAQAQDAAGSVALPLRTDGTRALAGLANWYSFWLRPLASDAAAAGRLLPALVRDLARRADRLTVSHLPESDAALLDQALRAGGWTTFCTACDVNHFLPVAGRSFAEYWAARPGQLRETVRRKGRKGVVELRIATAFDPADWAAYEAIYGLSWKPEEGNPALLRRFAEAEGAAGRLRMGIATIDGQPVAAQFWTVEAGTAFIHKLAHDESVKKHSPGTLLSAALFEHVIDRDGVAEVDFGTGDDPYKRDWMEAVRPRLRIEAFRPLAVRQWPRLARRLARSLRNR